MSGTTLLFVQINDFYHIDYLLDQANPDSMVLPRLSTLLINVRKLVRFGMAANVALCLPGDFLSPSCLSRHFRGGQMVDVLNGLGLDFTAFGNHEFDFEERGFQPRHLYKCLERSDFHWVCSNFEFSDDEYARAFERHARCADLVAFGSSGQLFHMFGLLYQHEFKPFGRALDPIATCRRLINDRLDSHTGLNPTYIALTHQSLEDDRQLAEACPELRLIMGGHDHDVAEKHRQSGCLIVKAKSNARSIRLNWVVRIPVREFEAASARMLEFLAPERNDKDYDPLKAFVVYQFIRPTLWTAITGEESINKHHPRYAVFERYVQNRGLIEGPGIFRQRIGEDYLLVFSIPFDSEVSDFIDLFSEDRRLRKAIDRWVEDFPGGTTVILKAPVDLAITDKMVRSGSTNFGNFVADVIRSSSPDVDIGFVNGGSFRLGRDIKAGEPVTARTLCEIFFHPNDIRVYKMPGRLIRDLLLQSLEFRSLSQEGHGDFLQLGGISVDGHCGPDPLILIDNSSLQLDRSYSVATTRYVAETAYKPIFMSAEFLGVVAPSIRDIVERALKLPAFLPDETPRWII